MRPAGRPALAALLVLGLLCAAFGVRVARHAAGARLELGRVKLTQVEPALRERLLAAREAVLLTYYVSARERMPSGMRRLERDVTDVLEALRRAAPERLRYQIVDPTGNPDLQRFASHRRVSSIRVRSVERDGYSEKTVWSSMTIACGNSVPAVVPGLMPEHLPRLQSLLVAELDQMEAPRRPVIALAASAGFDRFAEALAARGELLRVDLDRGDPLPLQADVLFWLDPQQATPGRLRELEQFLQAGRSVVLAGGSHRLAAVRREAGSGRPAFEIAPRRSALRELLAPFGLGTVEGIVCDRFAQTVSDGGETLPAPFIVRCIAPNQDFRTFVGQPNGHLVFELPAPLLLDGERLEARGLVADVLASTSDATWIVPARAAPFFPEELAPERGASAPKQPLIVSLRPTDPWQGLLVAAAASTPFTDEALAQPERAHGQLVTVLLDTLAGNDRLVQARLGLQLPAPLPELSAAGRALWRGVCVFLLPALLLVAALLRRIARFASRAPGARRAARPRWRAGILVRGALGFLAIAGAVGLARGSALRFDLTEERLNDLAPQTRALAESCVGPAAVKAEVAFSDKGRLPPALRAGLARLAGLLAELRRVGADLAVTNLHPEDLPAAERDALSAAGLSPVEISTRDEEVTTVRSVWCALRLSGGGRSTVLRFPSAAAFESLEFRLAFALWRLQTGREPHVGFASDVPRLSAAEAHEHYQKQGLFAPAGADVYSLARQSLADSDFRITHVNPREPVLPPDVDALVWLQPRRPVERMLEATVRHLRGGGRALLAAQHFVIQPRLYPGNDVETRWWPQPQTTDLERLYFPDLGVQLVREPFFDELKASAVLSAAVTSGDQSSVRQVQVALPFLVRAVAGNFAPDAPVTAHLGDQALPFSSYFELDEQRLTASGLASRTLISSSEHTWSAGWTGGPLAAELLEGPPRDEQGQPLWLGRVPLAIELQGIFPLPTERIAPLPEATGAGAGPPDATAATPWPPPELAIGRPARLVFVADSELFKNHRLLEPSFRADHLLRNAVASLALPPELAAVASRRPVARGFDLLDPGARLVWRTVVMGGFAVGVLLFGLCWRALRRRPAAGVAP